jgi:hypothetical protein
LVRAAQRPTHMLAMEHLEWSSLPPDCFVGFGESVKHCFGDDLGLEEKVAME